MATQAVSSLPIVDMSKEKLIPGTTSWDEVCATVRHALEEYGCFVALYDQLSSELNKEIFDVVKELFDLPIEIKAKNSSDILLYSYIGQLPHAPLHESMGIPLANTIEGVESFTKIMWPSGNDRFSNAILSYAKTLADLENLVDKIVFESYGAGKHLEQHVQATTYILRPIRYKPFQEGLDNGNIGCNVHTDKGFLAILHQSQVNALKVETREGKWIDVDFPPDSFVVMAGDAYEAWSNGRIHSPKHQVIMTGDKPRYCLAFFTYGEGTVEIPEAVVDEEHPLQYKPFDNMGLVHFYLGRTTDMTGSTAKVYCGIAAP